MPATEHDLSPIDAELKAALENGDWRRARIAITYGANPNAVDRFGEPALEWALDSWVPLPRIPSARMLIALGADASFEGIDNDGGPIYATTFGKRADEVEFLLAHGANPNPVMETPETLYGLVEFDYRFDLWDLNAPLKPTDIDRVDEESWLNYLDRCADVSGKPRPEYLRVLRRYGALDWRTRKNRREQALLAGVLQKVVSGGQTGADRAALDWAITQGITHGGWCPSGRLAEDGPISDRFHLAELANSGYRQRTRQNILDSDGTLIVNLGSLDGGTRATGQFAAKLNKPCLVIQAEPCNRAEQAEILDRWLHTHRITTLNVAGPRESKRPGIYNATKTLLDALLGNVFPGERSP